MSNDSGPEVSRLVEAARGSSVTEERLASTPALLEALDADEQPHFVLRGLQMDVEDRLGDEVAREDSRRRVVASGELLTVVTDDRLLFLVERPDEVEVRSVPYADLESVECEGAVAGNRRLVATGVDQRHSVDAGRADGDECRNAAAFADDLADAATASPGSSGSDDPLTKLERLADLRDRGALTDAEFESKKRELLERL